jgi:hypothetical protein
LTLLINMCEIYYDCKKQYNPQMLKFETLDYKTLTEEWYTTNC